MIVLILQKKWFADSPSFWSLCWPSVPSSAKSHSLAGSLDADQHQDQLSGNHPEADADHQHPTITSEDNLSFCPGTMDATHSPAEKHKDTALPWEWEPSLWTTQPRLATLSVSWTADQTSSTSGPAVTSTIAEETSPGETVSANPSTKSASGPAPEGKKLANYFYLTPYY